MLSCLSLIGSITVKLRQHWKCTFVIQCHHKISPKFTNSVAILLISKLEQTFVCFFYKNINWSHCCEEQRHHNRNSAGKLDSSVNWKTVNWGKQWSGGKQYTKVHCVNFTMLQFYAYLFKVWENWVKIDKNKAEQVVSSQNIWQIYH